MQAAEVVIVNNKAVQIPLIHHKFTQIRINNNCFVKLYIFFDFIYHQAE